MSSGKSDLEEFFEELSYQIAGIFWLGFAVLVGSATAGGGFLAIYTSTFGFNLLESVALSLVFGTFTSAIVTDVFSANLFVRKTFNRDNVRYGLVNKE